MRRAVTTFLGIVVLILVGWWGIRAFERANIFIPSRILEGKPTDIGLEYSDFLVEPMPGQHVHGWFIPAEKPIATLLFCHGNAGNISHRLDSIRLFHELNLNVLIFDYRGYGRSDDGSSEERVYADAFTVYQAARKREGPIVLFGRSLGGAVAVDLASHVDDAAALIVESSFTSTVAIGKEVYPFLPISWIVTMPFDSLSKIPNVRCPVLVIHSPQDDIIPFHHGKELFEAAPEPKKFLQISGDHNNGYMDSGKTYTDGIAAFLAEVLPATREEKVEPGSLETELGFIRRTIEIPDARLSCLVRPGNGTPLVFIPGSFYDSSQWTEVIRNFDLPLPIVLIELRGHGGSWPPPQNGSIEQFAGDVLLMLDEMKIDRFYVGGHSIGGMVALEVGRVSPSRVQGIVSVEGWTNHQAARDAFDNQMTGTLSEEQLARRTESRNRVLSRWTEEQKEKFGQIWKSWDGTAFLAATDIPILEIYGDRGKARPASDRLHIPQRDNITFHWIPNSSHCLPLERPAELAQIMKDYLACIPPAGQ